MKAFITGINGQDGSYLAELLLKKGYEVHGLMRRSSTHNTGRIDHILHKINIHYGDITEGQGIDYLISIIMPDEVYHLAAQSHVRVSFDIPSYTASVDAVGTLNVLEGVRRHCPKTKVYNATTSELFGEVLETPQNEETPFNPQSPYGVAKLYSYWIAKMYRKAYSLFVSNGILFNHESERRGNEFVTQKIVKGIENYYKTHVPVYLGNLDARRDWGYAPEYVEGMWLMLQQDNPDDFVLATGETHSIREFIGACIAGDNSLKWMVDRDGMDMLFDTREDNPVIIIDPSFYRPAEVDLLVGDASKAKRILGWEPKVKFEELVKIMKDGEK